MKSGTFHSIYRNLTATVTATVVLVGITTSAVAEPLPVFMSPTQYQFKSVYGVDVDFEFRNADTKRLDIAPGDNVVVKITSTMVDATATEWPAELDGEDLDRRFVWEGNLYEVPSLRIASFQRKGFHVEYMLECASQQTAFVSMNAVQGSLFMDWQSGTASKTISGRFVRPCDDVRIIPTVIPTIDGIILEGQRAALPIQTYAKWESFAEVEAENAALGRLRDRLNLLAWMPVKNASVKDKVVRFQPRSIAGAVRVSSLTMAICTVNGREIRLRKAGTCTVRMEVSTVPGFIVVSPQRYSFRVGS